MKRKPINYVSYAPQHAKHATPLIQKLERQRRAEEFTGRHMLGFSCNSARIDAEIRRSTVTILLVGTGTFDSGDVEYDVRASRDKEPPNEVLIILIDDLEVPDRSGVGSLLEACGTETVSVSDDLTSPLDRLQLRGDRGEKIGVSIGAPSCGTCGR